MIKRNKAFALIILCITLVFAGCATEPQNSSEQTQEPVPSETCDFSTEEIATSLIENIYFEDFMTEVTTEVFYGLYNLDENTISEVSAYESTGATAEEVVVIRVADQEAPEVIREAIDERIEVQKTSFENYRPEELEKLDAYFCHEIKDVIILVVAQDANQAAALLEDFQD